MFNRFNLFRKSQPADLLKQLDYEKLSSARSKAADSILNLRREVAAQADYRRYLPQTGLYSEPSDSLDAAGQIKKTEERIWQLSSQLSTLYRLLLTINRLILLGQISDQITKPVLNELMGKVDIGALQRFVDELPVTETSTLGQYDDMLQVFEQSWGIACGNQDDRIIQDPELDNLLAMMERLAMAPTP